MKCATLLLVVLALLGCGVEQAEAGFLSPHGEATISGHTGGPQDFTQQVSNDTIFLQNSAANSGNRSASAIVHTNPSPQFLGGQASATSGNPVSGASGSAQGIWRDVLSLNGPGPLPSAVTSPEARRSSID